MSVERKAHVITLTIVDPEEGLGQLRVAARGRERTWTLNVANEANVKTTAREAVAEAIEAILFEDIE